MTTSETEMLRQYQRMVDRCNDIIQRVEAFAIARGLPVGNGPVITLARQLRERNNRKVQQIMAKRGIL